MACRRAVDSYRPLLFSAWLAALTAMLVPAVASADGTVDHYQRLERMHHTAWTAKDGLVGSVTCLAQTTDGHLWIGTSNGLYRFDGIAFERFAPRSGSLPAASIAALLAVPDGGLWVGYTQAGVTFIAADGTIVNYTLDSGLPVGVIRSFTRDHDGVIWLAAVGGLARLDGGRWRDVREELGYPCRSAWKVFVDSAGTLWVSAASPNKVVYLTRGARAFREIPGLPLVGSAFVQLADDRLLLGDNDTELVYELRRGKDDAITWRLVKEPPTLGFAMDRDGGLWFAGWGVSRRRIAPLEDRAGPNVPPVDERYTTEQGLSGRVASDVLVDREQNVWVATEGGLDRFRRRNLAWNPEPRLSASGSLAVDRAGVTWLAISSLKGPGLIRLDTGAAVRGAPDVLVAGDVDPDGSFWFIGHDQLVHWANERFTLVPPPDEVVTRGYAFNVLDAALDRSGRLWVSVNGVGQFYRKDERWTFVPVLADRPNWTALRMHADAADRVWMAFRDQVAMRDGERTRLFAKAQGLDLGPVLAIGGRERPARDGGDGGEHLRGGAGQDVWVGGDHGLAWLGLDRFHTVQTALGTSLGAVADIVATRDGLWLNAASRIVHVPEAQLDRFRRDPAYRVRIEVFDLLSDLPEPLAVADARATRAIEDRAGVLWFLTNAGVVKVDPHQIVRNSAPPPIAVRALTADDASYEPRGVASLPALTRTIRIDYTAPSLAIPERVRFRYRLEGWETEWHDADARRTAFYTDLRPGRYAFRVLACNNDGVWNETGATLAFIVAPAWYQTIWFQALVGVAVAGAVALVYRIRLRRVSAALSARFEERLAERTRIARDLHDTLLQTVQASKMIADDALDRAADEEHVRRTMTLLSEWLGRAVGEGRAALNSLRASPIEVNDLAESFRRAAENPTKPAAMTVTVTEDGEPRRLPAMVCDEIYRIGDEAIRNAYAHSQATRLDITLTYGADLIVRIADNGIGVDPSIVTTGKRGHFGLSGMRERAANIGGRLTITGTHPGTCITLVVPRS